MIGRHFAHYDIVEKLGQGGMGEVYRAHDTKLGRDVALKILSGDKAIDAERRARFEREARAVAALKHPNIVTIYSVEEFDGTPFITMELVEGKSLDEAIPPEGMRLDRFFDYSIPLADAIGWAHERGITHRDLKPSNVMIDRDGRIKVLDFGLAKAFAMASNPETAETVIRTHDTAAGRILGTPAYMSPEQAEGKSVDGRSDIFSLGVVLYEMATGRRPFEGDTPISTISSILKDTPKSISDLKPANPRELGRIVSHCLEKDPERRFQTAKDVRNELEGLRREVDSGELSPQPNKGVTRAGVPRRAGMWWVGAAAVLVVVAVVLLMRGRPDSNRSIPSPPGTSANVSPSIPPTSRQMAVVLPFENLGPAEDSYFAAGVTEEITRRLASVSGLGVISRTSAENYSQSGKTIKQIGQDLGVDYVLEGSVRWSKTSDNKGRVRIAPQLVRVADDTPIWSETYDREVTDIFDVQTEIANNVVDALGVTLQVGERERLAESLTSNLEAYDFYIRGKLARCSTFLAGCDEEIVGLLQKAVELDPKFLAAWYELARHNAALYHLNIDRTEARLGRAKSALDHADAIDPDDPFTRLARGFYYYYGFRDYDRALVEFQAAVKAQPNNPEALWSVALIFRRKGMWNECIRELENAIQLDPKNPFYSWDIADTYDTMRHPQLAMEAYERTLAIQYDFGALSEMAITALRYYPGTQEARAVMARAKDPNDPNLGWAWANIYLVERDFTKAIAAQSKISAGSESARAQVDGFIAQLQFLRDGRERARPAMEKAAAACETVLKDAPSNSASRMSIAVLYAFLGKADDAVREARMAIDLTAKDDLSAPGALETLALVYAHLGREDEAIELIAQVLELNYDEPLTVYTLQKNPYWDPLRKNPKFQALLKSSS